MSKLIDFTNSLKPTEAKTIMFLNKLLFELAKFNTLQVYLFFTKSRIFKN